MESLESLEEETVKEEEEEVITPNSNSILDSINQFHNSKYGKFIVYVLIMIN